MSGSATFTTVPATIATADPATVAVTAQRPAAVPMRRGSAAVTPTSLAAGTRGHGAGTPSTAKRSISAASRVTRGTMEAASNHSAGVWSSPPTGARPSSTGIPAVATMLASPMPPVWTWRMPSMPSSAPRAQARSPSAVTAGVASMGGEDASSRVATCTPSTCGAHTTRSASASRASYSSTVQARRSIHIVASAGTMLERLPARATPTLTVVPRSKSLSASRPTMAWAMCRAALMPLWGSTPEWAPRPVSWARRLAPPLRALTNDPSSRPASRHSATSASAARRAVTGAEKGEPSSSSGVNTTIRSASLPTSSSACTATRAATIPHLSSATPAPRTCPSTISKGRSAAVPRS